LLEEACKQLESCSTLTTAWTSRLAPLLIAMWKPTQWSSISEERWKM
jgi:hypothetical protein